MFTVTHLSTEMQPSWGLPCLSPSATYCSYHIRPIVQLAKFKFRHPVIMGGLLGELLEGTGWGRDHKACILNAGTAADEFHSHSRTRILYVPTVTSQCRLRWRLSTEEQLGQQQVMWSHLLGRHSTLNAFRKDRGGFT